MKSEMVKTIFTDCVGGDICHHTVVGQCEINDCWQPVQSAQVNKDQFGLQDQRFRNRTSLFKDQISRGNASLQLTGVEVQDQGKYRCFTSTMRGNKDSLINLRVDAPVSKVNMKQVGNRIICSSEGIYPQPDLTWSTRPPSNLNLQNQTRTLQLTHSLSVSEDSTNVGAIIGGVVGAILVVAAVVFLVLHCKKKKGKITFCLNFLI
uniref:Ig-like domain-containing protein n=1 Tax=Lates calcarifer TaxID=8187 RepID=A0A4W6G5B1_LATCA